MIARIFGMLATPTGMIFFVGGVLLFFMLPMVPRSLNIFHRLSHLHLYLGARMLKRAAVVVSEQGDLLLKRMSPNDVGTEEIEFQDDTKEFEDPHRAKSNWMGINFAFADEAHGVLFSLRDAAIGRREKEAAENDELVIKATEQEQSMYEVMGWQKAVYELPRDVYELVNLNHVRHLMTGNERAEHPQRVKTYYRNSRLVYESGPSTARVLLLLAALCAPFLLVFFAWQQVVGNGGGGSTIVGSLLLIGLGGIREKLRNGIERIKAVDWGAVAARIADGITWITKRGLVVVPLPLLFGGIARYVSTDIALTLAIIMGLGFMLIPLVVEVLKISDGITHSLATTLIKLGLAAYRKPVWEETPEGYRLREFSQLDNVDEDQLVWHTLLGRYSGFTFTPSIESWGTEVADKTKLRNTMLADGGFGPTETPQKSAAKTNLPSGKAIIPEKQRAVYGSMVPSKIKENNYYLWTGITLGRFRNVATGKKTFKRLEKSKEEFGEDAGLSDKSLIVAMSVLGALSLVAGIVVFFVLIGV